MPNIYKTNSALVSRAASHHTYRKLYSSARGINSPRLGVPITLTTGPWTKYPLNSLDLHSKNGRLDASPTDHYLQILDVVGDQACRSESSSRVFESSMQTFTTTPISLVRRPSMQSGTVR